MRLDRLGAELSRRILVLDGAMGTMILDRGLSEADVRGVRFYSHAHELRGNHDLLVLTCPDVIKSLHHAYLDAGADIVQTNTFSSTPIVQHGYGLASLAYEMNLCGARLARAAADEWSARTTDRPRFVAGTIGPLNDPVSPSTFPRARDAYREQTRGLIDGGVDLLLIETVVNPLNGQAALAGVRDELEARHLELPVMLSAVANRQALQTATRQIVSDVYAWTSNARPLSVGLNCSFGVQGLRPFLTELSTLASTLVSCHPSAGLPNALGQYDIGPEDWASELHALAADGLLNFVGGCCGTTPEHIRSLARRVRTLAPRPVAAALPVKAQCSRPEDETHQLGG